MCPLETDVGPVQLPLFPPIPMSLADRADAWMHSPGGRHVMRDFYALAARYARDWRSTGIPVSVKLLFEVERHRIKCVTARALRRGLTIKDEYGYTLNNSYTAHVARHIMARRTDWIGMFEVRELRSGLCPTRSVVGSADTTEDS